MKKFQDIIKQKPLKEEYDSEAAEFVQDVINTIKEQMHSLSDYLRSSRELSGIYQRFKAYPYAQIMSAVDKEEYPSHNVTLEDIFEEIQEEMGYYDGEEEDEDY